MTTNADGGNSMLRCEFNGIAAVGSDGNGGPSVLSGGGVAVYMEMFGGRHRRWSRDSELIVMPYVFGHSVIFDALQNSA